MAVNPGTKYMGVAVFQAPDLVYWNVRVLKGKWSLKKMKSVESTLLTLINRYRVNLLVLKRLHLSRSSSNLDYLARSIANLACRERVMLHLYSLDSLKDQLSAGARINKMSIASLVASRYPFLGKELEREKKHKHPYYVRMFEAIAAGMVAFNRMG